MEAMAWWSLGAVALYAKTVILVSVQGRLRVRHGVYTRPEDARVYGRGAPEAERDVPMVERAQSVLRNDGENVPYFLALSLGYVSLGCWPAGLPLYILGFVVARYAHTAFYLWPRQPWRTNAYSLGVVIMLAMSVHLVVRLIAGGT